MYVYSVSVRRLSLLSERIETEIALSLYQCDPGCDFGCVMNMNYTALSLVKLLSPK